MFTKKVMQDALPHAEKLVTGAPVCGFAEAPVKSMAYLDDGACFAELEIEAAEAQEALASAWGKEGFKLHPTGNKWFRNVRINTP